jgi:hypothetical protein
LPAIGTENLIRKEIGTDNGEGQAQKVCPFSSYFLQKTFSETSQKLKDFAIG